MEGIKGRGKEIRNISYYLAGKALCQQFFLDSVALNQFHSGFETLAEKYRVVNLCKDREKS